MSYDLIGHSPSTTPVWVRAVVTREGDDVVTRCCVVAEGQVLPIEVRVNVPALAASLRAMGLIPPGGDKVSGFGSFLKKAVKAVTKNKVVKAVGKAVKKVANSPVAMIVNPAAVITAHTVTKGATGKGLVKGRLGQAIDLGSSAATAAAGPAAKAPSALSFVSPRASAALGIGLRTVQTAKLQGTIAAVAKNAQASISRAKTAATAVKSLAVQADEAKKRALASESVLNQLIRAKAPASAIARLRANTASLKANADAAQKKLSTTKSYAAPLVKKAIATTSNVKKLAPALAKQVVMSNKVKKSIANIAAKAKAGSSEAKQAAAVIAKSAQALDKILQLQAQAAGGLPGLLVTADGRIVRAPRGRFRLRTTIAPRPDVLYRGAKEPQLKGLFAAVSGSPAWGGTDDPGNDIEGPRLPTHYESGGFQLDDWSAVSGVKARRRRAYQPGVTRLQRELDSCRDAYDELAAEYMDASGIDRSDYSPARVFETTGVGRLTP